MNYVIYYKEKINRLGALEHIPILAGYTSTFVGVVPMADEEKRKIQTDFPQTLGNLFIHIDGVDFNLDPSASQLD